MGRGVMRKRERERERERETHTHTHSHTQREIGKRVWVFAERVVTVVSNGPLI